MAAGPGLLSVIGSAGARPFLAAAAVVAAAMALLLCAGREAAGIAEAPGGVRAWDVLRAESAAFIGIGLVGVTEACNLSLLPVMGLGLGAGLHRAALLVVVCQSGVAAGAFLCGALADRLDRRTLKLATGIMMMCSPWPCRLSCTVARCGRCWRSGAWPRAGCSRWASSKLGSRFFGTALARAMSLAMVIYTIGGIFGPPLMGAAMALRGPAGLVDGQMVLALCGVGMIAAGGQRKEARKVFFL